MFAFVFLFFLRIGLAVTKRNFNIIPFASPVLRLELNSERFLKRYSELVQRLIIGVAENNGI
jgi:hypothetical protein